MRFVAGLRADLAAVRAGLTTIWSNAPPGGSAHQLKPLEGQVYGRTGLAVPRQRVFLAA